LIRERKRVIRDERRIRHLERLLIKTNRRIDRTNIRVSRDEKRIRHIEIVIRKEFSRIRRIEKILRFEEI